MYQIEKTEDGVRILDDTDGFSETIILAAEYAAETDKMVFVCDELGLSIDSDVVEQVDLMLWEMTEDRETI